ncbi:hypothetical protein [Clostridium magnum]|nr:hypothetical protein [Clostridium magnum]
MSASSEELSSSADELAKSASILNSVTEEMITSVNRFSWRAQISFTKTNL